MAAAQAAHIFDFIESLPEGFDTRVARRLGLSLGAADLTDWEAMLAFVKQHRLRPAISAVFPNFTVVRPGD